MTRTLLVAGIAGGSWLSFVVSVFLGGGLVLCFAALVLREALSAHAGRRRVVTGPLLLVGLPVLGIGVQQVRCWYQPRPEPTRRALFEGVEYIREVVLAPTPAVVHLLKVDLTVPGVGVLVTPPDFPGRTHATKGRTTSQFVNEFGLQAAINGSNYFPFESRDPRTYWPYSYEPKGVLGGAASNGAPYGKTDRFYPALHISPDNDATIEYPKGEDDNRGWHTATAGVKHFIIDGEPIRMQARTPEATTAVGIDETGTLLFLVVVDGDQSPYSVGIDRLTLSKLLLRYDVHEALGLDGGGSSTMVVADDDGRARLVNRPTQGNVPGFERPVGNHIGISAPPLKTP